MKARIDIKNAIITLIYILIFVSAVTYMRFTINHVSMWKILYNSSIELIVILSVLYGIITAMPNGIVRTTSVKMLLLITILYELITSYFNGLFEFPVIIIDVVAWPCILLVFYDYSMQRDLPRYFKGLTVVGLTIIFMFCIPNILEHYLHYNGGAIFSTYYCFAYLPMIYYLCSRRTSIIYSLISAFIMLISTKRSAFLIVIIGFAVYYFLLSMNEGSSRKRLRKIILYFVAAIGAFLAVQYLIERFNLDIISRLSNMLNDGGSGRTKIWEQVMYYYNRSPLSEKWFGHGFHAVYYRVRPLGIARYAHNSLLETLYDYGIIGVSFILLFMIKLIIKTVRLIREKNEMAPIMGFCLIPLLILSFVSYFFEEAIIIVPFCVFWGVCLGSTYRKSLIN